MIGIQRKLSTKVESFFYLPHRKSLPTPLLLGEGTWSKENVHLLLIGGDGEAGGGFNERFRGVF